MMGAPAAVLLLLLITCLSEEATSRKIEDRIVNGTDAKITDYPFMISLRLDGDHYCGGTVLNSNWILTAAHCVFGLEETRFTVSAGSNLLNDNRIPLFQVSQIITHEKYNKTLSVNDVAVLKLSDALSFGPNIQPTTLPTKYQATSTGTSATVIGWGIPYTGGSVMSVLQAADIVVWSNGDCRAAYEDAPKPVLPSNICAGAPEGGKGQCSGDSGGPLIANGYQAGIVSWSRKPCTIKGSPGVFSQVAYYVDWIAGKIQS